MILRLGDSYGYDPEEFKKSSLLERLIARLYLKYHAVNSAIKEVEIRRDGVFPRTEREPPEILTVNWNYFFDPATTFTRKYIPNNVKRAMAMEPYDVVNGGYTVRPFTGEVVLHMGLIHGMNAYVVTSYDDLVSVAVYFPDRNKLNEGDTPFERIVEVGKGVFKEVVRVSRRIGLEYPINIMIGMKKYETSVVQIVVFGGIRFTDNKWYITADFYEGGKAYVSKHGCVSKREVSMTVATTKALEKLGFDVSVDRLIEGYLEKDVSLFILANTILPHGRMIYIV